MGLSQLLAPPRAEGLVGRVPASPAHVQDSLPAALAAPLLREHTVSPPPAHACEQLPPGTLVGRCTWWPDPCTSLALHSPHARHMLWDLRKLTPSVRKGSLAGVRQWVSETRDWGQRLASPSRFKPAAQRSSRPTESQSAPDPPFHS